MQKNKLSYTHGYFLILLAWLLLATSGKCFAWDSSAHMIIAQIAYDNLTPAKKTRVKQLIHQLDYQYPNSKTFVRAAAWADWIKADDVSAFNDWHYINIPYSANHKFTRHAHSQNVVWAINQANKVLQSPRSSEFEKGLFLRFLIHFVGDIHQPLHCINRYNKRFLQGDRSGLDVTIVSPIANNLHSFWDQGLGLFHYSYKRDGSRKAFVRRLANKIEQRYPKKSFGKKSSNTSPYDWAGESYRIAKNFVYHTSVGRAPTKHYINEGQKIAMRRVALAGYRLAYLLNHEHLPKRIRYQRHKYSAKQ